jgi:hypothetical protein
MDTLNYILCAFLIAMNLGAIVYYKKNAYIHFYYMLLHFPIVTLQVLYIVIFQEHYFFGLHSVEPNLLMYAITFINIKILTIISFSVLSPRSAKLNYDKKIYFQVNKTRSAFLLFLSLSLILMLIFGFLGLDAVMNNTRPAVKSGSMIFIIAIFSLIYPSLLNFYYQNHFNIYDIINILVTTFTLALLSKMHALAIVINLLIIFSSRQKKVSRIKIIILWLFIFSVFMYLQIAKDTADINYYNNIKLLLRLIYEFGNESFLGLYSAVSTQHLGQDSHGINYGIYPLINGILKLIPSALRPDLYGDLIYFDRGFDLRQSIVASLDEEFYRAFHLVGAFLHGIVISIILMNANHTLNRGLINPLAFTTLMLIPFMIRGPSVVVINHYLFMLILTNILNYLFVRGSRN